MTIIDGWRHVSYWRKAAVASRLQGAGSRSTASDASSL